MQTKQKKKNDLKEIIVFKSCKIIHNVDYFIKMLFKF